MELHAGKRERAGSYTGRLIILPESKYYGQMI